MSSSNKTYVLLKIIMLSHKCIITSCINFSLKYYAPSNHPTYLYLHSISSYQSYPDVCWCCHRSLQWWLTKYALSENEMKNNIILISGILYLRTNDQKWGALTISVMFLPFFAATCSNLVGYLQRGQKQQGFTIPWHHFPLVQACRYLNCTSLKAFVVRQYLSRVFVSISIKV